MADSTRRAVVIGINDYSASELAVKAGAPSGPERRVRNLRGAVNDAEAMAKMLTCAFGFPSDQVRLLRDQEATRQAILDAIRVVLIAPAKEGDRLVFFFAGHGSRVVNSMSDEDDGEDESLVPADSRVGARDLRDKELRRLFNRALEKRARLTVVLDSCHSGSAVRTANGLVARSVKLDPRDVKEDDRDVGPPLEQGGALVLAAAQEFQLAAEVWDEEADEAHGAFSLALLRSLRTLSSGESAEETFARTRARLRVLRPPQEPVISGQDDARSPPLFGDRADRRAGRAVVAVERIDENGEVLLLGGWVNGLTPGSRLESVREPRTVLQVAELDDLTHSRARLLDPDGRTAAESVATGELFAFSGWTAPPGPPLSVRIPVASDEVRGWAVSLIREADEAGVQLSRDPTADPLPTHVLQWRDARWQLTGPDGEPRPLGGSLDRKAVLDDLRGATSSRLFVELPAPAALAGGLAIGPGTDRDKIEPVDGDRRPYRYVLAGRRGEAGGLEFAWVTPGVEEGDQDLSPMPLRSRWHGYGPSDAESAAAAVRHLEEDAAGLARVHSWLHLESRGRQDFPYRLGLEGERTGRLVVPDEQVVEGDRFGLVLRADEEELTGFVQPHYVYVFSVDSFGKCTLLFPLPGQGSVGNRFPAHLRAPYPTKIVLGPNPLLAVAEPYGVDVYYLLATVAAIHDPWVLNCPGVRDVRHGTLTELDELLLLTGSDKRRDKTLHVPDGWFLERLVLRSVRRPTAGD